MANERKICMIIGSAPITGRKILQEFPPENCYVICADGGIDSALGLNIQPDLIVGDFDSAKSVPPQGVETIRLPVEKDETDMLYAVKEGFRRGFNFFVLLGGLGGERFDHSIANLCVLSYIADRGGRAVLADYKTRVFMLTAGRLLFTNLKGSTLSVFPFGVDSCRVTYKGLQYPMVNSELRLNDAMGVSNCITGESAEVFLHQGRALVVLEELTA